MSWINKIKEAIQEKKEIGLIWFIEELEIEIKHYNENGAYYYQKHATEGFGDNEYMTNETLIQMIDSFYDRPDLMFIDGKEV